MARVGAPRAAWRRGDLYDYLHAVEKPMFAWEWLRRTSAYRRAWARACRDGPVAQGRAAFAFGLVTLLSPRLAAPDARPIWRAGCDPHVLQAHVSSDVSGCRDLLDIRRLARAAEFAFAGEDAEHWRIEIAGHAVRIDVHDGTLLGGPTPLRFELFGLEAARPQLPPLDLLIRAALDLQPRPKPPHEPRAARWIGELRTADALAAGASQQEIARAMFDRSVPAHDWRAQGESYRLRVQRLVRAARARLRTPLDPRWFS
ncbi:MAG: DUF2285 domain-containing protein [Pseudomonadota bacterium]